MSNAKCLKKTKVIHGYSFDFNNQKCVFQTAVYGNNNTAIVVMNSDLSKRIAILTVNFQNYKLEKNEFFVKTWSENKNISKIAAESGLFEFTGKWIESGFVRAEVWKLAKGVMLTLDG